MDELDKQIQALRESILQTQVDAALQGHDLTGYEVVDERGFQAKCRKCGGTVWVGVNGLIYSMLADSCSGLAEKGADW
jgi:hypothetical protein